MSPTLPGATVTLRLDPDRLLRWHLDLAHRLEETRRCRTRIAFSQASGGWPPELRALFTLETLLFRLPADHPLAPLDRRALAPFAGAPEPGGLTVDLCREPAPDADRAWRVTYDGSPDQASAIAGLLGGHWPTVAVVEQGSGAVRASGTPGAEGPGGITGAFGEILARAATLLERAMLAEAMGGPPPAGPRAGATAGWADLARYTTRLAATLAAKRIYHLCFHAPHWRVGWRFVEGPDTLDLGRHPDAPWRVIPDDGHRFYADPFPFVEAGTTTVFVEDFPHRTGKGLISAIPFGPHGPTGPAVPVLEQPVHLSYPFVFRHRDQIWMISETSQARRIDLFRAAPYPTRWTYEATLVEDVCASDATLVEDAGRWWLFASVRDRAGSHSDALHLWYADDVRGPWHAHALNPVLVDAGSARPAGAMARRGGRLLRPVQDCRRTYGGALAIAAVDALSPTHFAQTVVARLEPGPQWPGRRLHTLNRAGRLECIDGSALCRRKLT